MDIFKEVEEKAEPGTFKYLKKKSENIYELAEKGNKMAKKILEEIEDSNKFINTHLENISIKPSGMEDKHFTNYLYFNLKRDIDPLIEENILDDIITIKNEKGENIGLEIKNYNDAVNKLYDEIIQKKLEKAGLNILANEESKKRIFSWIMRNFKKAGVALIIYDSLNEKYYINNLADTYIDYLVDTFKKSNIKYKYLGDFLTQTKVLTTKTGLEDIIKEKYEYKRRANLESKKLKETKEKLESKKGQIIHLENIIKSVEDQKQKLQLEIDNANTNLTNMTNDFEKKLLELETNKKKYETKIEELQKENKKIEEEYKDDIEKRNLRAQEMNKTLDKLNKNLQDKENQLITLKQEIQKINAEKSEFSKTLAEKLKQEEELKKYKTELEQKNENLENLKQQIKELESSKIEETKKNTELQAQITNIKSEVATLQTQINEKNAEINKQKALKEGAMGRHRTAQQSIDSLQSQKKRLEEMLKKGEEEIKKLEKTVELEEKLKANTKQKNTLLTNQIKTITEEKEKLQEQIKEFENKLNTISGEKQQLLGNITKLQKDIETLNNEINPIRQENEGLKTQIEDLQKQKQELDDELKNSNEEYKKQKKEVEKLLEEQKQKTNEIDNLIEKQKNVQQELENNKEKFNNLVEQINKQNETINNLKNTQKDPKFWEEQYKKNEEFRKIMDEIIDNIETENMDKIEKLIYRLEKLVMRYGGYVFGALGIAGAGIGGGYELSKNKEKKYGISNNEFRKKLAIHNFEDERISKIKSDFLKKHKEELNKMTNRSVRENPKHKKLLKRALDLGYVPKNITVK